MHVIIVLIPMLMFVNLIVVYKTL